MRKPYVDEKLFRAVKLLIKGGATTKEAAEYFNISEVTVGRIRSVDNYTEYKNMLAAMALRKRNKALKAPDNVTDVEPAPAPAKAPEKAETGIMGTHYMNNRIYELLKEQNELLKLLSNKLAFIVDALS